VLSCRACFGAGVRLCRHRAYACRPRNQPGVFFCKPMLNFVFLSIDIDKLRLQLVPATEMASSHQEAISVASPPWNLKGTIYILMMENHDQLGTRRPVGWIMRFMRRQSLRFQRRPRAK
jgi:hypothetical protein